ncbi:BTAD domain-containing putative transcriptional regulator [Actinoplanes sp. NPDC051861]|uniref:AfsR/SARP family transcriptional regulator n=1 Tax=Actinoplanes sp. NPDC051861 TaxID=3155170 RepID=UPI0034235CD4
MPAGQVEFRVLGALEVVVGGQVVPIPADKLRIVLTALLLRPGRVVPVAELVGHLWETSPPVRARATIQTYVARLRALLRPANVIHTHGDGYLIDVDSDAVDLDRFRRLVAEAEAATGDPHTQAALLRTALALWRGPALSNVSSDSLRALVVSPLDEERLAVEGRRIEVELSLGRHRHAVADLRALTAEHPLREQFWELLMVALHGSGRQAEALEVYRTVHRLLHDELGIEPGEALRRRHREVLNGEEPATAGPPPSRDADAAVWWTVSTLPQEPREFVGREELTKQIVSGLQPRDGRVDVPIMAICGPPGAGKTALALRVAHRLGAAFPDGQWFVRLGGTGASARHAGDVVAELLLASGVNRAQIPDDPDTRSALLRARLADRSVLLLLDDVASAAQVRALLPGTTQSAVLVTARAELRGLTASHAARLVTLDVLPAVESQMLLRRLLGDETPLDDGTAAEIAHLCGFLPLALRLAAARLAGRSAEGVAHYLAALCSENRLSHLAVPGDADTAVRATFDLSYGALPPAARRLFRLLGVIPGADFTTGAVAALMAVAPAVATELLDLLAAAFLVQPVGGGRYQLHDLLRLYAREHAEADQSADDAQRRLLDWYLRAADSAADLLYPDLTRLPRPDPIARRHDFGSAAEALQFLETERENLTAAIASCQFAGPGTRGYAWHLADALRGYFHSHTTTARWRSAVHAGLQAARQAGAPEPQAALLMSLGLLHWTMGEPAPAIEVLSRARETATAAGLTEIEGAAVLNLGVVHLEAGSPHEAIRLLHRALDLGRAAGRWHMIANSLINLGGAALDVGRFPLAQRHSEQALALCEQIGSAHAAGIARTNLGQALHALGRPDEAIEQLTLALETFRQLGSMADQAEASWCLAIVLRDIGRLPDALRTAGEAVAHARRSGVPRLLGRALTVLGAVHERTGGHDLAVRFSEEALRLLGDRGHRRSAIEARITLAAALRLRGDPAEALGYARSARDDAEVSGLTVHHDLARTEVTRAEEALARGRR